MDPTSTNINQKLSKIRPKIVQNRGLKGSGAGLEASWAVFGDPKRLWRHLGPSWRHLGGVLEGSWRPLGRSWAEQGRQHGSNLALKMEPKPIKDQTPKLISFLVPLGMYVWKDFGGFWMPTWSQVGTRIDQRSMPIAKSDFFKNHALAAAGARFLIFWGSKLGVKID